jgi:dienelactone hydrolase
MRVVFLVLALLGAPSVSVAGSNFTRINPPGPHAVGLKVVEQYDVSRAYRGATDVATGKVVTGERARPIQTFVWYPAVKTAKPAMTVADYLKIGASDDDFEHTPAERADLEVKFAQQRTGALSPARAKAELTAPMQARRDVVAASGRFPVVIYAPSFSAWAFENADLCEYLASQGYVVIASPSLGQASRDMTTDLEGVETQAADIEFLIGYAHGLPQADTRRLAVVGYSWGGLANVLAAAKDSRISALVALDGSVRSWPQLLKQAAYATEARATAPLLYIASRPREIEDLAEGRNAVTSPLNHMKYADVYRVTLTPMAHENFSVMFGQRLQGDKRYGDYDKDELSTANAWMETYVRRFLDAYLKDDTGSRAFLDLPAAQSGAPAHLLTTSVTHSQGAPPTRAAFAAELARLGFDKASSVYQAFKTREPAFTLSDDELISWGYQRMGDGDIGAAVALLRLDTEVHADSWNAFDSLGEAYAKTGDKALAIAAYRRSLVLNPKNVNGVEQLKALGAQP